MVPVAPFGAECAPEGEVALISKELLDILACPICKTPVRQEGDRIVCDRCGRRYPVRDEIPVMLVDEAESADGKKMPAEGDSPPSQAPAEEEL